MRLLIFFESLAQIPKTKRTQPKTTSFPKCLWENLHPSARHSLETFLKREPTHSSLPTGKLAVINNLNANEWCSSLTFTGVVRPPSLIKRFHKFNWNDRCWHFSFVGPAPVVVDNHSNHPLAETTFRKHHRNEFQFWNFWILSLEWLTVCCRWLDDGRFD